MNCLCRMKISRMHTVITESKTHCTATLLSRHVVIDINIDMEKLLLLSFAITMLWKHHIMEVISIMRHHERHPSQYTRVITDRDQVSKSIVIKCKRKRCYVSQKNNTDGIVCCRVAAVSSSPALENKLISAVSTWQSSPTCGVAGVCLLEIYTKEARDREYPHT